MPRGTIAEPQDAPDSSSVYVVSLDRLEHAALRTAVSYWRSLRGGRRFPSRSQLSPRDMAAILRHVVLLKVLDGGADYEYRIAGDAHVQAFSIPFKGLRLGEVSVRAPVIGRVLKGLYEHVRSTGEAFGTRGWVDKELPATRFVYYESALLPLGEDDETVDHILIVSIYVPKAPDF
ncbi:MAG TPA: PAS domain-containing protein [Rhizomicrobium sp.]